MVKEPRAGLVKTRLGREIGMSASAWWFRHQALALLRRVADRRWDIRLAVTPDRDGMASRFWPAHLPRLPQGGGDLGARMARLLRPARGPVVLIGADIPAAGRAQVARAFAALRGHDAVFGPAEDGGFWLVGLRRGAIAPRGLFQGVRWSGEHALSDSLATARGLRVALVDRLRDVDRAADL